MAINYPGPYELRLFYTVTVSGVTFTHEQRLNVDCAVDPNPGDAFSTIDVIQKNGGQVALDAKTDAWVAVLRPLFHSTSVSFVGAELWKYTPGTFVASFVSAYSIGLAGTSGTTPVTAGQAIWSFRTIEGGIMKVSLMESSIPQAASRPYTAQSATEKAVADFVTGATGVFLARDTSYPFVTVALHPGLNEALVKRRYRTS